MMIGKHIKFIGEYAYTYNRVSRILHGIYLLPLHYYSLHARQARQLKRINDRLTLIINVYHSTVSHVERQRTIRL